MSKHIVTYESVLSDTKDFILEGLLERSARSTSSKDEDMSIPERVSFFTDLY